MELAPVAASFSAGSSSGADNAKAKRKLDTAHAFFSPLTRSPSPSPRGANNTSGCVGLPHLDSHPKVRRRGTSSNSSSSSSSGSSAQLDADPALTPTRSAVDGKMPYTFTELPVAESTGTGTDNNSRYAAGRACPKSPAMAQLSTATLQQKKSISPRDGISPRVGICSSPGLHHMQFAEDESDSFGAPKGPTSPSAVKLRSATMPGFSMNGAQSQSPSPSFTPPTPNKRVCSQQSMAQSKAATAVADGWVASPVQPRKRMLGASDSPHSTSVCPADKRLSLSLEMDLESRSHAMPAAHSSGSSTTSATPQALAALSRGSASAPKRSYQPLPRRNRNPGNLSLDLSQMDQPGLDPTGSSSVAMRRNDQAAVCSKVTDFLFIGGATAAKDKKSLLREGITHVINCAASVAPAAFPKDFRYLSIRLRDHSSQDIAQHFYNMFDFIETARQTGGRVFVHCVKGISRSPTMAIAYLMWHKRIGMYQALDFVRRARPIVDPNAGFIFQLTEWEQLHLDGCIQLHRPVVFRVELPYDSGEDENADNVNCREEKSLLVGPLSGITTSFFREPTPETRELSFIVACAKYLFVWCGSDAREAQVEAAQDATQMLQRYEAFPMQCDVVVHGQESEAFWRLVTGDN